MALVNQKLYKVTLYFVVNLPSFKPSNPQPMFPWHFIQLELSLRAMDETITTQITESDLCNLVRKYEQTIRAKGQEPEQGDILAKEMSNDDLLRLILDSVVLDPKKLEIHLSTV